MENGEYIRSKPDFVAHFEEARRRIIGVDRARDTALDLSDLSGLESLPPDIAGLAGLQQLYFSRTQVADLSPLTGLTGLKTLDFNNTLVADLSPLTGLTGLQQLNFSGTRVADLSPLSGLTGLQILIFKETRVSDLTPLSGLTKLENLNFSRTLVSDLAPLAGLEKLEEGAGKKGGMSFYGCLHIDDPVLTELSKKKNPERTIETLRYLREQVWKRDEVGSRNSTVVLEVESGPSGPVTLAVGSIEKEYNQPSARPSRQVIVLQINALVQALSENIEAATTRRNEPPAFDLALGNDAAFLDEIRGLVAALQGLKETVDLPEIKPEKQKTSLAKDALREFVMKMAGEMGSGLGRTAALGAKLTVGYFAINILKDLGVPVDDLFKTLLGNFPK